MADSRYFNLPTQRKKIAYKIINVIQQQKMSRTYLFKNKLMHIIRLAKKTYFKNNLLYFKMIVDNHGVQIMKFLNKNKTL